MSRNKIKLDSRPIEEKIQDKYYKYFYDMVQDTYKKLEPYLSDSEEIQKYFSIAKVNAVLEKDKDKVGDLNYYKYLVAEFILSKDENKDLVEMLKNSFKQEITNEKLNIVLYQYFFMQYTEAMDLLKMVCKCFYLIDKYKNTPLSDNLIKWLNSVNHYENYKPIIFNSEDLEAITDKEEKSKAYKKAIEYYNIQFDYVHITNILSDLLIDMTYNDNMITKRLQENFFDYFALVNVSYYLQATEKDKDGQLEPKDYLEPIINMFSNRVKASKDLYDTRGNLEEILEEAKEQYNINITLSEEEQKIINDKVESAKDILNKYDYKKIDYISNFNTLTYLLAFNDETKKVLKDNNTDLSIQDLEESKEPITSSDKEVNIINKENTEEVVKEVLVNDSFSYLDLDTFSTKLTDTNININRDWVALNNTIDGREILKLRSGITTFNKNNTKPLRAIIDDKKATKEEKEQAQVLLNEILKKREEAEKEINERKDNLSKLARLEQEQGKTKDTDKLIRENKRKIKDLEKIINEPTLSLQGNLDNKLVYQRGKNTLMIPTNHNIENITDTGNDLIMFIGNEIYHKLILKADKDILQDDDTYINIDLDEWANFRGYEHRNYSVLRKEIAKELDSIFYEEYNIKGKIEHGDNKGDYELKGRIVSDYARITLNDKTTFKVSLGTFYRKTWESAILTGQIANIPTKTMQLGNKGSGKNTIDKAVKELAIYFRQMANIEKNKHNIHIDKKGLYYKDFKMSTILDFLREKDLIQQSDSRFLERVKEKIQDILNRAMAKDIRQFLYQTNAFDRYDTETSQRVKESIRVEHFKDEVVRIFIDLSNDDFFNKSREIHQAKIKNSRKKKSN